MTLEQQINIQDILRTYHNRRNISINILRKDMLKFLTESFINYHKVSNDSEKILVLCNAYFVSIGCLSDDVENLIENYDGKTDSNLMSFIDCIKTSYELKDETKLNKNIYCFIQSIANEMDSMGYDFYENMLKFYKFKDVLTENLKQDEYDLYDLNALKDSRLNALSDFRTNHFNIMNNLIKVINKVKLPCLLTKANPDRKPIYVSSRLKNKENIIFNLCNFESASLDNMSDIASVRVVVDNNVDFFEYIDLLKEKAEELGFETITEFDHTTNPIDGWLEIYIIFFIQDGYLIELEIKNRMNLLVENMSKSLSVYDYENKKDIKQLKRFFYLANRLLYGDFKTINEIKAINKKLDIYKKINDLYMNFDDIEKGQSGYFVLTADYESHIVKILRYEPSQIESAMQIYNAIETSSVLDCLFVYISDTTYLKEAFPFLNGSAFIKEFNRALNKMLN